MSQFLVYKSSAGSGKTSTLIEIFLKLSLVSKDARNFKKLLAITFTNKAAGEMKDRFIEELDYIRKAPKPYSGSNHIIQNLLTSMAIEPKKNSGIVLNNHASISAEDLSHRAQAKLQTVLHDYSDLSISTIDRFNHQLIRSFSHDLGLKSDFEVEMDTSNLFREAVDRLIEKVGVDEEITNHLLNYVSLLMDEEKGVNVISDLENLKNLVMSESGVEALTVLKEDENLDFHKVRSQLFDVMTSAREAICRKGEEAIQYLEKAGFDPDDFTGKARGGIWAFCKKMKEFKNAEIKISKNVEKGLQGEFLTKTASAELQAKVAAVETPLINLLQDCVDTLEENQQNFLISSALLMKIDLLAVLEELSLCLDEICEERNVLPISSFNMLISEALRKESVAYLYEHYGVRFDHILIDEFQDTSELQWFNVLPLIEESVAKGKVSMVVGDAKQSIYRWRGGKAEQLINLPQILGAPADLALTAEQFHHFTCIADPLNTNYRTRENIVNFNNAIFAKLGADLTSPNSPYSTEYAADNVSQNTTNHRPGGYVRIEYLGHERDQDKKWQHLYDNIDLFSKKGYNYSDMAILVRSATKEGREIIAFLKDRDIPVSTAESFEIDQDEEVKLIMALMRLSIEPQNIGAQITAMRSMQSIFDLEFAPHRYVEKHGKGCCLNLNDFLRDNQKPPFQSSKPGEGIYDLTQRLISTYLPTSDNAFLSALLNVVVNQSGLNGTCQHFFEWWDALNEKPSVPGGESDNAVQLTTIHKAKGLEYPIVIIPDLNWAKRAVHTELKWVDLRHKKLPIPFAPLAMNSNLEKMGLQKEWEIEEEENKFDNLNLVYVALTRPVHALCISYQNPTKSRIASHIHDAINHLQDSVLSHMPGFKFEDFGDDGTRIELGEIPKPTIKTKTEKGVAIPKVATDLRSWHEKVKAAPQIQNSERLRGVRFHKIVSLSPTHIDAQTTLQQWIDGGLIDLVEHSELKSMIDMLYTDATFNDLLNNGKILAEREIYHNDEVIRPDLIFDLPDKLVLIDFKTGVHDEKYIQQIRHYGHALRQMYTKPIQQFLVYLQPVQWVEVF